MQSRMLKRWVFTALLVIDFLSLASAAHLPEVRRYTTAGRVGKYQHLSRRSRLDDFRDSRLADPGVGSEVMHASPALPERLILAGGSPVTPGLPPSPGTAASGTVHSSDLLPQETTTVHPSSSLLPSSLDFMASEDPQEPQLLSLDVSTESHHISLASGSELRSEFLQSPLEHQTGDDLSTRSSDMSTTSRQESPSPVDVSVLVEPLQETTRVITATVTSPTEGDVTSGTSTRPTQETPLEGSETSEMVAVDSKTGSSAPEDGHDGSDQSELDMQTEVQNKRPISSLQGGPYEAEPETNQVMEPSPDTQGSAADDQVNQVGSSFLISQRGQRLPEPGRPEFPLKSLQQLDSSGEGHNTYTQAAAPPMYPYYPLYAQYHRYPYPYRRPTASRSALGAAGPTSAVDSSSSSARPLASSVIDQQSNSAPARLTSAGEGENINVNCNSGRVRGCSPASSAVNPPPGVSTETRFSTSSSRPATSETTTVTPAAASQSSLSSPPPSASISDDGDLKQVLHALLQYLNRTETAAARTPDRTPARTPASTSSPTPASPAPASSSSRPSGRSNPAAAPPLPSSRARHRCTQGRADVTRALERKDHQDPPPADTADWFCC